MNFLKRKIVDPLIALLKQGLSPSKLALSVALGAWISVLPALGLSTFLCIALAFAFGLNIVALQTANYAAYPFQFVLLFPFFRAGEWIFKSPPITLSPVEFVKDVTASPIEAVSKFWVVTWQAIAVWAVLGLILVPLTWFLLTPIFARVAKR